MDSTRRTDTMFLCDNMPSTKTQTTSPLSLRSSQTSVTSYTSDSSLDSESDPNRRTRQFCRRMRRKPSDYIKRCPQFPARKAYVSLDCEMVGVGTDESRSSLARVVILDWRGHRLFDHYIKQSEPVTDYRTFVSGITEQDLLTATMPLHICRMRVSTILSGKILVGHGLENDLSALGIDHPWWMIRDTACYEPFMNARNNILLPRKLKDLVHETLGREIQEIGKPHSPYEDARWAMNLYKSERSEWESQVQYMVQRSVIESSIDRLHRQFTYQSPYGFEQPVY